MRHIETEADIAEGVAALVAASPEIARLHALVGDPPLRRRPGGFHGLARIVAGQQLSVASAEAIWRRLEAAVQPFDAPSFLRKRETTLKRTGLSAGKIATLRGIAKAIADGSLHLEALHAAPEAEIHATLTALKGVGPWTADIYLLFCLGRADAWSPGDLALQMAIKDALSLETRPDIAEMQEIAEAWRPWRGVAARLLWSYYAFRRRREAMPLSGPPRLRPSQSVS